MHRRLLEYVGWTAERRPIAASGMDQDHWFYIKSSAPCPIGGNSIRGSGSTEDKAWERAVEESERRNVPLVLMQELRAKIKAEGFSIHECLEGRWICFSSFQINRDLAVADSYDRDSEKAFLSAALQLMDYREGKQVFLFGTTVIDAMNVACDDFNRLLRNGCCQDGMRDESGTHDDPEATTRGVIEQLEKAIHLMEGTLPA